MPFCGCAFVPTRTFLRLGAASGFLLCLAELIPYAAPIQLVAFVPLLIALRGKQRPWHHAAAAGALLGIVRLAPWSAALGGVPWWSWPALVGYLLLAYAAFGAAANAAWHRLPGPAGPLGVAAAFALIEVLDGLLPMWGTALSLARAWADHGSAITFVGVTGPASLAFIVVGSQALAVRWLQKRQLAHVFAFVLVLAVPVAFALQPAHAGPNHARPDLTLRVAALGWPNADTPDFEALVATAAAGGAKLVVSPEGAFRITEQERAPFHTRMGELAQLHHIHLAVGYIDRGLEENRVTFYGPDGTTLASYTKTHLIPMMEKTRAGSGDPVIIDIHGVRVGVIICQDDNFSDRARIYRQARADIVLDPTFEMSPAMGALHLRSARLRPIEGQFTLVRAVARGTSAIISPHGTILASHDHLLDGPGIVITDIPANGGRVPPR